MITMQVTDKNIIYPAGFDVKTQHLLLGTLAAVN
jgi:hypothetical protein